MAEIGSNLHSAAKHCLTCIVRQRYSVSANSPEDDWTIVETCSLRNYLVQWNSCADIHCLALYYVSKHIVMPLFKFVFLGSCYMVAAFELWILQIFQGITSTISVTRFKFYLSFFDTSRPVLREDCLNAHRPSVEINSTSLSATSSSSSSSMALRLC